MELEDSDLSWFAWMVNCDSLQVEKLTKELMNDIERAYRGGYREGERCIDE